MGYISFVDATEGRKQEWRFRKCQRVLKWLALVVLLVTCLALVLTLCVFIIVQSRPAPSVELLHSLAASIDDLNRSVAELKAASVHKLYTTADNEIVSLYIDVKPLPITKLPGVGTSYEWQYVKVVDVPINTKVVAAHAWDDNAVTAGILASIEDGSLMTNGDYNWKCIAQNSSIPPNWFAADFDDSDWSEPVVSGKHGDLHGNFSQISPEAKWIWTRHFKPPSDQNVYCRGYTHGDTERSMGFGSHWFSDDAHY